MNTRQLPDFTMNDDLSITPKASRQLPKSLHTITVLENLARHILGDENAPITAPYAVNAVNLALKILKLDTLPDGHGLAAAALLKLKGKAHA